MICKDVEDPIKSLITHRTFSKSTSWEVLNPGKRISGNYNTHRPLVPFKNLISFMQHCAIYTLVEKVGQMWPIRWTKSGFVVSGFYKNKDEGFRNLNFSFSKISPSKTDPLFSISMHGS